MQVFIKKKTKGGEDVIFLLRMMKPSKQSMENCFTTLQAAISPTAPFQDCLPALPSCPNLPIRCSTAPASHSVPLAQLSKALQSSTSAYTLVLISSPTLSCIPAPFLINPISHTPGYMASPRPSCMLAQVPWNLTTFLLKSEAKLFDRAWLGPEPNLQSLVKIFPFPTDLQPMGSRLRSFCALHALWLPTSQKPSQYLGLQGGSDWICHVPAPRGRSAAQCFPPHPTLVRNSLGISWLP